MVIKNIRQRDWLTVAALMASMLAIGACSKAQATPASTQTSASPTANPTTPGNGGDDQPQGGAGTPPCSNCPGGPGMGGNHGMGPGMQHDSMHDAGHMR